ncbi:glycoside hydrolase family 97 catalytic domain-containing protein [Micromonospora sp. WMMD812]|uniref:glycoside hydrolase family 97 catalytic domain-containing protein n=1 Tax=Micromonospora sp. WMMD812 TaxID=3015152 RepID=UPI00248B826E|nr:glycoside hydrolase family 97 catalytic domain-containing protein [Micromonospora sp. WMMD812]WBB69109.1 glycoside hydrolase family 97 catalytic domain-containing protein [Micromonospora sp. WMMD812]
MVNEIGPTALCERVEPEVEVRADGVVLRVRREGRTVLDKVLLGIRVGGLDLDVGSVLLRSRESEIIDEWTARSGKATGTHRYAHLETVYELRHESGFEWQIHVRASADGVAVRYVLARLEGHGRLDADRTRLTVAPDARVWALEYQTWYETPRFGADVVELPPGAYGFPLLVRLPRPRPYVLLTEAAIDGRFSGAHAEIDDEGGTRFALADESVEITRGPVTPWRVFLIGDLAAIVESRFVDELAPAHDPSTDARWVRPGRAAWSWWSDFHSGAQLHRQRHFVDVAARLGWEHLLIDCGWDETWVPEIVAYASRRGIQVHLWAVWHDLDGPQNLAKLALWRSWGVAGIKVDFMESESKDRYRWYDRILAETARLGLHVNFHGSVIPRGWARTWPQVIGYEAVRGSEYYVFYQDTPLTAAHNVIQPFTRNVVGAMDHTPVAFGAPGRTTSDGHELALSVAFECGITHFADDVDAYLARPQAARFLAELAPSWDETVLLAGDPDHEAVLARRHGDRWFIGGIATGPGRRLTVPLDRLALGPADAWIVGDGAEGGLASHRRSVDGELIVEVADNGGFAAIVAARGTQLHRAVARPEQAAPRVEPPVQLLGPDGTAVLRTDGRLRLPPGWSAEHLGGDRWTVSAPAALAPGRAGVVTVETPGEDDIPIVAHARLFRPLTPGSHRLSTLTMVAFDNESGPIERDQSNGGGNPADGRRMSIAGTEFDDGLGASTPSRIDFYLGGSADRFTARIGIDDETPGTAARMSVHADGMQLFSADVRAGEPPLDIDLDIRGADTLCLHADTLPIRSEPAHVDWASGRLHLHHTTATTKAEH